MITPERRSYKLDKPGWCGPAALQFIAKKEGISYSQAELVKLMGTTQTHGTSHEAMLQGAKDIGFRAFRMQGYHITTVAELLPLHHVIVNWMSGPNEDTDGHYSVLREIKDSSVILEDATLSIEEFTSKWYDFVGEKKVEKWALVVAKK